MKKNSLMTIGLLAVCSTTLLSACVSPSSSGSVYSAGEARREQIVRMGVVESVREVSIEGEKTPIGAIGGAVVGGVAGSRVGEGRGSTISSVLGAVAGSVAGQALEQRFGTKKALEITVKMDSGELRAFVQESEENFRPGERVRIVSTGGTSRVSR